MRKETKLRRRKNSFVQTSCLHLSCVLSPIRSENEIRKHKRKRRQHRTRISADNTRSGLLGDSTPPNSPRDTRSEVTAASGPFFSRGGDSCKAGISATFPKRLFRFSSSMCEHKEERITMLLTCKTLCNKTREKSIWQCKRNAQGTHKSRGKGS